MKTTTKLLSLTAAFALVATLAGCGGEATQEETPPTSEDVPTGLQLNVSAEGWSEDTSSSPVAIITPASEDDQTPDALYRKIKANEDQVIELEEGTYTLGLISPINADGSIYTVPDDQEVKAEEITGDANALELTLIPADQVQTTQLEGIVAALTVASQTDPTSVPGETVERAKANALANPNTSAEQIEAAETSAQEAVASGDKAAVAQSTAARPTASAPSGDASGTSAAQTPATSQPAAQTPAEQTPAHVHSFDIPVYGKEPYLISDGYDMLNCSCGATFSSFGAWVAHNDEMIEIDGGHSYSAYSVPPQYGYRDVVTGYKCSCGAIQPK